MHWPAAFRLPVLDLVRLLAATSPAISSPSLDPDDIVGILLLAGFEDKDRENNIMLTIRAFSNLFETTPGRALADSRFDQIHRAIGEYVSSSNRNLLIAVSTLYLNYAVLLTSVSHRTLITSMERGLSSVENLTVIIKTAFDSEASYRALIALGTMLELGDDLRVAARDVYDLPTALGLLGKKLKEPRIKAVVGELNEILV